MRLSTAAILLVLSAGCAAVRPAGVTPLAPRWAELARVRCLLVLPFENASDVPLAAATATQAAMARVDAKRTTVLPISDLRALFRDTPFELPPGVSPGLALELAELLGADAALYGVVEGRIQGEPASLAVTLRLELAPGRDLLFGVTAPVDAAPAEQPDVAVARTVAAAAGSLFSHLGGAIAPSGCFDPGRTGKLRALALALAEPRPPGASPRPTADGSGRKATARQAAWSKRLAAHDRFLLEGVGFEGRSARLTQEGGLVDLVKALEGTPQVKIRVEGFVDPLGGPDEDARLSSAMAQAAARRLIQLGISPDRVSWAGRGAARPVLPNFTIRGRAANRRLEVVGLE